MIKPLSPAVFFTVLFGFLECFGQDVVVNTDTTWTAGTHMYDSVTVEAGATLTLESDPVTGTGCTIQAASVTVASGAAISADGQGYPANEGPATGTSVCGAGHGGRGGVGATGVPGEPYGSAAEPATLGSGSMNGEAGGGAVRLIVSGTLHVDGVIAANGLQPEFQHGGSAGGSIWVTTGTFSGSGFIQAQGGAPGGTGYHGIRGGGGGGRIAIHYEASTFSGTLDATGADDGQGDPGEDGTVACFDTGTPGQVHLITGHAYRFEAVDAVSGEIAFDSITMAGSSVTLDPAVQLISAAQTFSMVEDATPSTLTIFGTQGSLSVAAGAMTIGTNCVVHVNGKGYQSNEGPSQGSGDSGAGHGGFGGTGNSGEPGGVYGSAEEPVTWGSGAVDGGAGGGAICLEIAGTLDLEGSIQAHGTQVTTANGGGAGGSIWVTAHEVTGSGSMTAHGGAPGGTGLFGRRGGGGGGRIAVYRDVSTFTGSLEAWGEDDGQGDPGEDGTVAWFDTSTPGQRHLLTGHAYRFEGADAVAGEIVFDSISLAGSLVTVDPSVQLISVNQAFSMVEGTDPATLTVFGDQGSLHIDAASMTIGTNCVVHVNGKGYQSSEGPSQGSGDSGAGHGGRGGTGHNGGPGEIFGSALQPVTWGSGAANGGAGGGAIRLDIAGTLLLDGSIQANGIQVETPYGGGAGGSILIQADCLTGSGSLAAIGGAPGCTPCFGRRGGGGGGRIAVHVNTNDFTGTAEALGGDDGKGDPGEPGTVGFLIGSNSQALDLVTGHSWRFQRNDALGGEFSYRNIVLEDAHASIETGISRVHAQDAITLSASTETSSLTLYDDLGMMTLAADEVTVGSQCSINVDGKGYRGSAGPGTTTYGGGAGYGGDGGVSEWGAGGGTYGSAMRPRELGSGGGNGTPGGGVLQISATHSLTIDGVVSANAYEEDVDGGGGSGGSVLLSAFDLMGTGIVEANGAKGGCYACFHVRGGGGGGRVAVYFANNDFSGLVQAEGGPENHDLPSGEDGTVRWVRQIPVEIGDSLTVSSLPFSYDGFRLDWPHDTPQTVLIRIVPENEYFTVWSLAGGYGEMPSTGEEDWIGRGPTGDNPRALEMIVPLDHAGPYYFSVYNALESPDQREYQFECLPVDRYVTNLPLGTISNRGTTTKHLFGAGFEDGVALELRSASGGVIDSDQPSCTSSTELTLSFYPYDAMPQTADVAVVWPNTQEIVLEDCIEIVDGSQGHMYVSLSMPQVMRPQRVYTLWVNVENYGNSNVRSPILRVTSQQNLGMRVEPEDPFERGPLLVLGAPEQAPVDTIPPGTRVRFPIQFLSEGGEHAPIDFSVDVMEEGEQPAIWAPLKDDARPDHWPTDAWNRIWDNFTSRVGDCWGAFAAHVRDHAEYLFEHGAFTRDVRRMMYLAFADACAHTGINATHTATFDAYSATPGLPLAFGRQANNTLNSRFIDGPLGLGWTHTFMSRLEVDGDIATVFLPGGYIKRYVRSGRGEWQSEHDDFSRFSPVAGGYEVSFEGRIFHLFDGTGRLLEIRDNNDNVLSMTYSGGDLTQISHSNGDAFHLIYSAGRLTTLTDHTGRQTHYTYVDGRLSTVTHPDLGETHYTYTADQAVETVTHPDGTQTRYTYDTMGRMATRALTGDAQRLTYTYPDIGRVTFETDLGAAYAYAFGPFGEALEFIGPNLGVGRFAYNGHGQLTEFEEPDGSVFARTYDSAGNMITFVPPDGNQALLGWDSEQSRLRWVRDARWGGQEYTYDDDGNLEAIVFPDGSMTQFAHEPDGRVSQVTNRRGDTIALTHDAQGVLTERQVSTGETFSITRDAAHRPTAITGTTSGTTSVTYDASDQITSVSYPNGHSLAFAYDEAGKRTRLTFDDGYEVNYLYDAAGRPVELQDKNAQMIVHYAYDAAGRVTSENRRNGTSSHYTYNDNGWLTDILHEAADRSVLEFFHYTYDEIGQITQVTSSAGTTQFRYDQVGQLVEAAYPDGSREYFTYDAAGNRMVATTASGTDVYVTNSMNQYTQVGSHAVDYDADGNLTSDGDNTFVFNAENRLTGVNVAGANPSTYTYDASVNLAGWTQNGASTTFLIDPNGLPNMVAEYDEADQLVARYIYGFGLTARVDAADQLAFYNHDQMGHTRLITDHTGVVVNRYAYRAFGEEDVLQQDIDQPFRFGGAYGLLTDACGIVHVRARTYSPTLGRFFSPDPIHIVGGANLYAYAQNDPINLADPSGLMNTSMQAYREFCNDDGSIYSTNAQNEVLMIEGGKLWANLMVTAGSAAYSGVSLSADPVEWGVEKAKDEATNWLIDWIAGKAKGALRYLTGGGGKNGDNGPGGSLDINQPGGNTGPGGGQNPGSNAGGAQLNADIITGAAFQNLTGTSGTIIVPGDPNEKVGPLGRGPGQYMTKDELFHYTVYFENVPTASAPAQEVFVTDVLDAHLDWSTFRITEIAWGDIVVDVPPDSPAFQGQVLVPDYRGNAQSLLVDLDVTLDGDTGEVSWTFRSLDPLTLELPEDALAGFLPPNDADGRGEGHVSFSIRPRADTADETVIANSARIVFDTQPYIDTNEVFNTIGIWVHPNLKSVVQEWRFGTLCGTAEPSVLEFVAFIDRDYSCP